MRRMVLISLVAFAGAGPVQAEMVKDQAAWRKLSAPEQVSYAGGFIDGHLVNDGSPAAVAYAVGVTSCFAKLSITAKSLAATITDHYARNPKDQSSPPGVAILKTVMRGPCLPFINAERKKYKLAPLTKSDG